MVGFGLLFIIFSSNQYGIALSFKGYQGIVFLGQFSLRPFDGNHVGADGDFYALGYLDRKFSDT